MDINTIRRAQQGDEFAINDIYEAIYKRVYYLTYKIVGNSEDAEDATQDTFISAFKALPGLADPDSFQSWLFQIAANRSRDLLRKNKRHETVDVSSEDEDHDTFIEKQPDKEENLIPEDALDNEAKRKIILEIISNLPDNQKECVMMFYYSEMSVKDIAVALGVSEGTVKSRLNYARQKIKDGILETEEKQDIRLHALIPLGLFLFKDFEAITAGLSIPTFAGGAAAAAGAATSTAGATGAAGTSASAAAVGGTQATAAGVAKAGLLAAAKTKIIAGVLTGVLAVGGIAAAVTIPDKGDAGQGNGQTVNQNDDSGEMYGTPVEFSDPNMEHNMRLILGKKKNEPVTKEELFGIQVVAFTGNGMNIYDGGDVPEWADGTAIDSGDAFQPRSLPPAYPGTKPVSSYADLAYFFSDQGEDEQGLWIAPLIVCVNSSSDVNLNQIFSLGLPEVLVYAYGEGMQYYSNSAFGEGGSRPLVWDE